MGAPEEDDMCMAVESPNVNEVERKNNSDISDNNMISTNSNIDDSRTSDTNDDDIDDDDEEDDEDIANSDDANSSGNSSSNDEELGKRARKLNSILKETDVQGKIRIAEKAKVRGTEAFKVGNFVKALKFYKRGCKCVNSIKDRDFDDASFNSTNMNGSISSDEATNDDRTNKNAGGSSSTLIDAKIELSRSCELNICMCYLKMSRWYEAIGSADNVLKSEPNNPKALYRRGVARSNFGLFAEAKADLMEVLKHDSGNAEVVKELNALKIKINEHKLNNKKAFSGLFSGGVSLYSDKEKERREKEIKFEEERKLRREQWHRQMDKKKAEGEEEISFDKWCEIEDTKKKEKADREEKERLEKQKKAAENNTQSVTTKSSVSKLSDDHLDEEDLKILDETKKMGYCYFRRDLTEEEKRVNALNKPQKLDDLDTTTTTTTANGHRNNLKTNKEESTSPQKSISSWNSKGTTYEEKDMSGWCIERFTAKLKGSAASYKPNLSDPKHLTDILQDFGGAGKPQGDPMEMIKKMTAKMFTVEMETTDVKDVGGEGHISVVRGTKRYIFDLHATIEWIIKVDSSLDKLGGALGGIPMPNTSGGSGKSENAQYRGSLVIRDVSSARPPESSWLSDSSIHFKETIRAEHKDACDSIIAKFRENVIQNIDVFHDDYRKSG